MNSGKFGYPQKPTVRSGRFRNELASQGKTIPGVNISPVGGGTHFQQLACHERVQNGGFRRAILMRERTAKRCWFMVD